MRKTRLVILPGVRSITQIGCLLLFLACPTIAFKGQEKRDVEPMCKFHELKYWWLPFDTGEGNNSTIPQKWPGYECQRENMATTNGKEKDNVTDSIQHSCDETTISHRRVAIQGQDENYNLEINFRRNKMRVIHSSPASEMPSKRIGSSERRTAGRREVPQTVYKNERVSQTPVERRVAFYQYQRSTPDRQTGFSSEQGGIGSRARTMIRNRFQQNRREGSETKVVNDRRRLVPVSERRDEYKKIRLSTRINTEFTGRYQHLESQQDSRARSEQSDKRVSALVCIDKRGELNRIKRDNNSPQQNILQRLCSSPLLDRKENAQRSCPEYHNSRIFQDKARKDRKLEQNSSPTRQEIRETIHDSRVRIIQRKIQEEQPRMDRQRQSVISIDNERSLSDKRRAVRSVDSSLDRRMREDNIQRNVGILGNYRTPEIRSEILRESRNEIRMKIPLVQNMLRHKSSPIYKTSRETTNRSAITIIQRTNDEEQSRMVRRHGRTISRDDERSLSDRKRPVRSVDSLLFSLERKLAESDMVRNSRIRERDISRENIPPLQNRRLSSTENTQRSLFIRVQPKDSREQSRIERILERAMNNDNERLSNRRSLRPSESRVFSLDRRMGMVNQRDDIRKHERDISGDNGSPIHQRSSYERRENIRQSPVTTGRSLESVALLNDKQRLSNIRTERSVESHEVSLNRRRVEPNQRRDIRMQKRDISRENASLLQNMLRLLSSPEQRENLQRSSFIRVQGKDNREQSRIDRRIERAVNNDNERLSRSKRSVDSRASSLDRRVGENNLQRDIRMHERDIYRENALRLENKLQRRSSFQRRENIQRSSLIAEQLKDSREQSRTDRRIERAVNNDNEQRLSRSMRSVNSRASSLDRRVGEPNQRRDIRLHEKEILHENSSPLQNMLRRLSSPERRENIQRSSFIRVQPKDSREQSRIDRRLERAVTNDNERRMSNRRAARSADSRASSLDRRVGENNLQRDIRMHERYIYRENALRLENKLQRRSSFQRRENIQRSSLIAEQLKDSREQSRTDRRIERAVNNDNEQRLSRSMRSVDSRASSLDRRVGEPNQRRDIRLHEKEISHENSSPLQNMLRRLSSPERRENIQRSSFIRVQPKDSREQSRIDRRLERAVTNDNERRMSNRRAARSADSRVSSLDRRVGETNQRRDIRMHEREIPREERSSLIIVQPKDSREQSRIDRRLERAINNDNERRLSNKRSVRSVDTRVLSLEKRVGRLNTREDIRKHERDISRDSISPVQITLQQRNSLDRRETILQSPFTIIKSKESREQYRTNRKLERVVSINDYQRLSNRRAERCLESREVSIERRMGERRDIVIQKRISRANVLLLQNNLQRRSSSERREIILRSAVIPIHSRELEDLPTDDRKYKRGVYMGIEQRTQRRDISRGNSSPLQQRNSVERRENIRESTITIAKPKDSRGQSRTGRSLELVARINEEQRLSNGWEERSLESHEVSLNRRRVEPNQRRDIRMQKRDISRENASLLQNMLRRLSSPERRENLQRSSFIRVRGKDNRERSVDSRSSSLDRRVGETNQQRDISREDALRLENKLQRRSSFERRENIQRSSLIVVQLKDSREQSRTDRRIERAVNNDNEQRLSRSRRSIDSRASSLDRRVEELNQRRNIRLHERYISRENSSPLQNMLRRLSSPERRGNLQRSSFLRVRGKDNREQSKIDRRIERAVNNDNERLSRSKRSVDFRASSLERRVGETNQQRDISREETSPIQNMLRRLSTPEQRENIQRSSFIRIQPKDSREQSRIDRSLERGVYNDNEQRLSNRRLLRSVESRVFSSERKFAESDLQRDGRIRERDLSRENIPPVQNKRLSSPENTQRSLFIRVQPKDSREQSRIDRRLERSVTNDNERRLSNTRSLRSVESRVFSLERMLTESDLQRDGRIRERDLSRENIPPLQNRRLSSPERRENIQRSSFIRVKPKDSREQSSMVRRLERSVNNENERRLSNRRSLRAVESQFYSLDRRMTNLREDISKDEKGISRDTSPIQRNLYERRENILQSRIDKRLERGLLMDKEQVLSSRRSVGYDRTRSNMLRDSRNTIRENTFQLQNSLRQLSSSALIDRRESSHRSVFSIIKPTDLERQSRGDTRLKSAVSIDNEQRLSDKRLVRSVDSRVFLLDGKIPESRMDRRNERARYIDNKHLSDMRRSLRFRDVSMYRRMTESRLWRDRRIHEKDMSREESFPRRLQTGVSSASSAQRFRERRTVVDSVEISPERKFETSSRRNKLDNVDRREDVSRFNKRHTQERRVMLSQRSISERTNDLHRQTSSSELHLRKKPSSSHQRTDIPVASTVRVSKYELYLSTMLDMSQNYDDAQLSNTRKSASSFPSWNGKLISAIKKAVTGSDVEETILKDSGLKSSQGFALERQIREIRPDSEIRSNDKGHLLQDFVMGSVIAGFFISSIHQKLRDYRNFICIF